MDELNDFLKLNGFVLTIEPILSKKYFGNYICEYTNNTFGCIINILNTLYKKKRRCFLIQDKETDGNYFHNLISSKDIIQTDIQVKLLRRYFTEVMTIFYENNLQLLSKIESEKIDLNQFIEKS